MFKLTGVTIEPDLLKKQLLEQSAGAFATFEGWVRNHNVGKEVIALEYEAYESLALKEGQKILAEVMQSSDILNAFCIHRTGQLAIGDIAVWIGVTAVHRDAAFKACKLIIDQVKLRLPIWKKEHYMDGSFNWVNCQQSHNTVASTTPVNLQLNHINEIDFYSKQVILPEVSQSGQLKLKQARVLVVGAGGLGSSALLYLAAAGIGTIGICEFDRLETSNLHRQILYEAADIGKLKSEQACLHLKKLNPFISIVLHKCKLNKQNAESVLREYDFILDCTDNLKTKLLLNDMVAAMSKGLIQASIYRYEGQLVYFGPDSFVSRNNQAHQMVGQCLRCLWPNLVEENCVTSCTEVGVLGVVPGMLGSMQALETIKLVLGLLTPISDHVLIVDLLSYRINKIKIRKLPSCTICASSLKQQTGEYPPIVVDPAYTDWHINDNCDVEPQALLSKTDYTILDIREEHEKKELNPKALFSFNVKATINIPLSQYDIEQALLPSDRPYLIVCQRGIRSKRIARKLRKKGFTNVYSLNGGLSALELLAPLV